MVSAQVAERGVLKLWGAWLEVQGTNL